MEKYEFNSKDNRNNWKKRIKLEEQSDEYVMDPKVMRILRKMHKERFSNESSRKYFMELIASLLNARDKTARMVFKIIGKHLQGAIKEILSKYKEDKR